jgi:periplasmic protein TonB
MGKEGTVAVRVTIGADGRVTAVQEVRATSDAFFRATQQHARQPAAILSSNGGWETG